MPASSSATGSANPSYATADGATVCHPPRSTGTVPRSRVSGDQVDALRPAWASRSEEHTSELQSLMSISYAVFCLKKKKTTYIIEKVICCATNTHYSSKVTDILQLYQ